MSTADRVRALLATERGRDFLIDLMFQLTISARSVRSEGAPADEQARRLAGLLEVQHLAGGILVSRASEEPLPEVVDTFLRAVRETAEQHEIAGEVRTALATALQRSQGDGS